MSGKSQALTLQNWLSRVSLLHPSHNQEAAKTSDTQKVQDCSGTSGAPTGLKVQSRAATENTRRPPQVPTPTTSSKNAETGGYDDTTLQAPTLAPVFSSQPGTHANTVSSLGLVASTIGQGQLPSPPHLSLGYTLTSTQLQPKTTASFTGRVRGSKGEGSSISSKPPVEPTRAPISLTSQAQSAHPKAVFRPKSFSSHCLRGSSSPPLA